MVSRLVGQDPLLPAALRRYKDQTQPEGDLLALLTRFLTLAIFLFLGCVAYAARDLYWRPVMPAVVVETGNKNTGGASQLMVIYGEHGRDPLRTGTLAADECIAGCEITDGACVSSAARHELKLGLPRQQSLQVRRIDGRANPVIGYVVWRGPAFPRTVRISCDMTTPDLRRSCRLTAIDT